MSQSQEDLKHLEKSRQRLGKKLGKKHHELWSGLSLRQQNHWAAQFCRGIPLAEVCEAILARYRADGSDLGHAP